MAKIILTTGGTGGHIFPAIAVAETLRKDNQAHELLFIGSNYGPERRICERAGIKFEGLPVRGFLGRGWRALPASLDMGMAVLKAMRIMTEFKPDVVAAFGGYASFAPSMAAVLRKTPLLLQEQNAIAGTSNRFLARFASKICLSLPETKGFPDKNTVVTGNPVRGSVAMRGHTNKAERGTKRLLVLGGSQGAHALNVFMPKILANLADVEIHHQTGEKDLQDTREAYARAGRDPQTVNAFIDDMESEYDWADLILCRSGASTVAEICAAGLPSILVPFPAAIHDHQTFNARILVEAGAAELVPENTLDVEKTSNLIQNILNNPNLRKKMGDAALKLARPAAARLVANEVEILCQAR